MATTLMNFASQSIVIMHMSSFCDPAQFDESTITEKCEWNSAIRNLLSKVFEVQGYALFLSRVRKEIDSECIGGRGWPFSQQCSMESCNYKWSISLDMIRYFDTFAGDTLEKIGFFEIETATGDVYSSCLNFRTDKGRDGFAYGGFWAYTGVSRTDKSKDRTDKFDDCAALPVVLRGTYSFGAVPNYVVKPDLPKCAATIDDVSLWGPNFPSDESLKRYTPDLSCKQTSEVSRHFNVKADQIDECWKHCSNEAKLKPIFFFTVDTLLLLCKCYSTW
jgi:hypothetical protein